MKQVPFKRELRVGMQGQDVRALQRALRKAHFRKLAATGDFRRVTRRGVIRFQKAHGIRKDRGIVKKNTWDKLQPYFDGYDLYLVNKLHVSPPLSDKVDKFVKTAWWYYGNRPLHYIQERPMNDTQPPPNIDNYLDCSEFVYVCAKAAGLPDPSGFGYTAYGNTDSFLAYMKQATGPSRGCCVFYDDPGHVAICVGQQRGVWMVLSNGSDGGPLLLPYNYRQPAEYRRF